jgi:hypothetical protein
MDNLSVDNQILLLEAIRRFYSQSDNKEIVLPMACQWYNEKATQFLVASEFRDIVASLFEIPQRSANIKVQRPFTIA